MAPETSFHHQIYLRKNDRVGRLTQHATKLSDFIKWVRGGWSKKVWKDHEEKTS